MDESSKLVQSLLGVSRPVLIFPHADPFSLPIERLRRARRVLFVFRANPHGRTMPTDVELLHARRWRGVSAIRRKEVTSCAGLSECQRKSSEALLFVSLERSS